MILPKNIFYFIPQIPVALPERIFLTCIGHTIHPGSKQMHGARMMPGIPICIYLEKTIASGIFTMPAIIEKTSSMRMIPVPLIKFE